MAQIINSNANAITSGVTSDRSLLALRTEVRRNLHNDSQFYTDTDINRAINRAYRRIAEFTLAYVTLFDTTTTAGTNVYDKPANCIQLLNVVVDNYRCEPEKYSVLLNIGYNGNPLEAIIGRPSQWCEYSADRIVLYPTPDSAYTLRQYYAAYPDDLAADTDIPVWTPQADEYIINFSTGELMLRDGENDKYYIYQKKSNENQDLLKRIIKQVPIIGDRSRLFDYPL